MLPVQSFFSLFYSVHRDQIACSLLGGFSKPRTAAYHSLDSGLCSMLSKFSSCPFICTRSAPFRPTWAACPDFCFPHILPLHVCPQIRIWSRFCLRFLRLGFLPVYARLILPPLCNPRPLLCFASSQRSRSGRVAIYCATVFCPLLIDVRTPMSPASFMAPSSKG